MWDCRCRTEKENVPDALAGSVFVQGTALNFGNAFRCGRGNVQEKGEGEKVNTKVMFSSKITLWETPQDFFDNLNDEFHFTLDVCALPENAKCESYYTPEQDGLRQAWVGTVWCNPPYGRGVDSWVRRAWLASKSGNTVVMLLPARTDTKWFHDYIYNQERVEIRFVRGRLKFAGSKNNAPFPSMICIFSGVRK